MTDRTVAQVVGVAFVSQGRESQLGHSGIIGGAGARRWSCGETKEWRRRIDVAAEHSEEQDSEID